MIVRRTYHIELSALETFRAIIGSNADAVMIDVDTVEMTFDDGQTEPSTVAVRGRIWNDGAPTDGIRAGRVPWRTLGLASRVKLRRACREYLSN